MEPMVVTTAIPFWSNGSIAYLSTTATAPPSSGFRTGPAPVITATFQLTSSGLRIDALPLPPTFSQTGFWTNTTGSFASPTLPVRGSGAPSETASSQGNRSGTFSISTSSLLGTGPRTTLISSISLIPGGDPNASQLGASGSPTGPVAQSTTGARVGSAYTSEGQLCSVQTVTMLVP